MGLLPDARYEQVMAAFGGHGYFVHRPEQLRDTLSECLKAKKPCLINTMISPNAARKTQVWKGAGISILAGARTRFLKGAGEYT